MNFDSCMNLKFPVFRKVDVVRAKPSIIIDTNDQHLSPVNNTRRSQFAPVLSSTPVHQTSPVTTIPVDLTCMHFCFPISKTFFFYLVATPSVAPVLTINSNNLPAIPPSAIVPQRANITRPAGRPPRIPRGESVTRQKKHTSPIKEQQQEETVLAEEIRFTSKRRIKTKQEIIEDNIEVIIEQKNDIIPDVVKQVQATPLRGRKKKIVGDDINIIPQLEPPPPQPVPLVIEDEVIPKKVRGGRGKKKDEEEVKPTRTTSRNRKKQEEDVIVEKEQIPPPPPKRTARNKKLVDKSEEVNS